MASVQQASPIFRNGVEYRYQTNTLASGVSHRYHFEASNGFGYAVFDAGNPQSRNGVGPLNPIIDIRGPFLNDPPILQHNISLLSDTE